MYKKGHKHSEEVILKNRLWHLGRRDSDKTRLKKSISHFGMKHTPQEIEKIRIANTGVIFNEERKQKIGYKMSLAHKKWRETNPIKYSLRQSKAMASNKFPSKPELKLQSILPIDFELNKIIGSGGEADLHSKQRKIIFEVDGPTHYKTLGNFYNLERLKKTQERDKNKKILWNKEGYKVFRFSDIAIMKDTEDVKKRLKDILK